MAWIITKYLATAVIVVIVSEAAKYSDKLGGFIAALPIVTILTLIWLFIEGQPEEKISNHATYTLWYVIPTLPMFLAFPFLYSWIGFWPSLLASLFVILISFACLVLVAKSFGIDLL